MDAIDTNQLGIAVKLLPRSECNVHYARGPIGILRTSDGDRDRFRAMIGWKITDPGTVIGRALDGERTAIYEEGLDTRRKTTLMMKPNRAQFDKMI